MGVFQSRTSLYRIILTLLFILPISAKEKSEMIGKKAAPLSLFKLSNNKYYRTKDIIGKKNIVISFFGTWCAPCRKEIPKLQEMSNELKKDDYEFLLICVSNIKPPGSTTTFKEEVPKIKKFIEKQTSVGILLIFAALLAMLVANSPLAEAYHQLWEQHIHIGINDFVINNYIIKLLSRSIKESIISIPINIS